MIVGLGLAGCSRSEPKPAAQPPRAPAVALRFQTDWYPQPEHGGFYQALARGFYAEAGLDVTILPGGPGARTSQRLAAGAADMGIHRSDDLMVQAGQGLPFVIVGSFMQRDPQALLLHASDPVRDFADLDGRTIMAMPGTTWVAYLQRRFNITFNVVPMSYSLAQFIGDPRLIQQCFVTNEPYFLREHAVAARTLLLAEAGYEPYRAIFTTRRFLNEHPDAVAAFVQASLRGWQEFIHGDATAGKALIRERNPEMTEDFIDYSIAAMREHRLFEGDPARGEAPGQLRRERLAAQAAMLVELGILVTSPQLDELVVAPGLQRD